MSKMAASILGSSRCLPRSISCLRATTGKAWRIKYNGLSRDSHTACLVRVIQPSHRLVQLCAREKCSPGSCFVSTFHNQRGFRSTSAVYDGDVQTVVTPAFADSVTEGDVRWHKEVGDAVVEDEIVAEIETDKTAIGVNAPGVGVIEELLVADGDTVQPGTQLFKIRLGAGGAAKPAVPKEAPPPEPASSAPAVPAAAPPAVPPPTDSAGPIPTTPPPVPPTPKQPMTSIPVADIKPTPGRAAVSPSGGGACRTEVRVKMNRMRQRIAQRLKDAQNTCAMLTTFNEIDMSNVIEMRTLYKEAFMKKHGVKLSFMSSFLAASAYALKEIPAINATIDEKEIVYRDYMDISVAVATPKGLVVPVIKNVESMTYADIERTLGDLGNKARSGLLAVEDMDGGTFTISNGGVFGSLMGTPIINPPQSAILGMHGIFDKPVAIKGKVEIRPMMYVALTYDHRLVDGREAAIFLRTIKSCVEDPRLLLLQL